MGISPLALGVAGFMVMMGILGVVVWNATKDSSIENAAAAGVAAVKVPTMAPTLPPPALHNDVANSLPGFQLPVYLVDGSAPTAAPVAPAATPTPTNTPWPTVAQPTPGPTWTPKYAVINRWDYKAVVTPMGSILCAQFGVDLSGNMFYFGGMAPVAGWFYGLPTTEQAEVINACRGAP